MADKEGSKQPVKTARKKTEKPSGPGSSARDWAVGCHLAALAGFLSVPFGHVLGPLVVWLIKKDSDPFIDEQGKEALNFQLSILIYSLASILMMCLLVGFLLLPLVQLFNLIMIIVAAVKAGGGDHFHYPLCIRFLK